MTPDYHVDVAVVGAGACGMMAALQAARDPHLSIALFEKSSRHGCNTQFSSGSLAAGGTRFQAQAGIHDTPEDQAEEILRVTSDHESRDVVLALCRASAPYVEWLADELDYPMELGTDMPRAGFSVPRLHTDKDRGGGQRLVSALRAAIGERLSISLVDNCPGVGLLGDGDRVTGVRIREQDGEATVGARAVVLAADGFAADPEMVAAHCPQVADSPYLGVSTSTGEAIRWAQELGAATRHLGAYLGSGLVVPGHNTRVNPALPFLGALLVDQAGRRFIDETTHGYSQLGELIAELPGQRAAILWDQDAMEVVADTHLMRESTRAGAYQRCDDLEQATDVLGLDVAALAHSANELAARPQQPHTLRGPLYATWITRGLLTTQGGLVTDTTGRVRRTDERVIPGLFAGGGSAAGISGSSPGGYVSGNGLLAAMGFGWIIGNHLASAGADA